MPIRPKFRPIRHLLCTLSLMMSASLCAQDHSECSSCHTRGINDPQAGVATLRTALPQLCIDCHQGRIAAGEHRINIQPISAHPATLPLLEGRVSCSSCHDPHGTQPAQLRLEAAHLCQDCHRK